jgi:hypothetical protein
MNYEFIEQLRIEWLNQRHISLSHNSIRTTPDVFFLHPKPHNYFLSSHLFDRSTRVQANNKLKQCHYKILEENLTTSVLKVQCQSSNVKFITLTQLLNSNTCDCNICITKQSRIQNPNINSTQSNKPSRFQQLMEIKEQVHSAQHHSNVLTNNDPKKVISKGFAVNKVRAKINFKLNHLNLKVISESAECQSFTFECKHLKNHTKTVDEFLRWTNCNCAQVNSNTDISKIQIVMNQLIEDGAKYFDHMVREKSIIFSFFCKHNLKFKLTTSQILIDKQNIQDCYCKKFNPSKPNSILTPDPAGSKTKKKSTKKAKTGTLDNLPSYYLIPNDETLEVINDKVKTYDNFLVCCPSNLKQIYPAIKDLFLRTSLDVNVVLDSLDYKHLVIKYSLLMSTTNLDVPLVLDYIIPIRLFDCNDIEHIKSCWSNTNVRIMGLSEKQQKGNGIRYQDLETIKENNVLNNIYFKQLKLR